MVPVKAQRIARAHRIAKELRTEFQQRLLLFMSAALGAVSALFWQTAITDTIKSFIPVSGAWSYELAVALIITLISVTGIYFLSKFQPRG